MTQSACAECGEASPSGVQFCPACGHYLWDADGPVEDSPVDLNGAGPTAAPVAADPPTEFLQERVAPERVVPERAAHGAADPPTAIRGTGSPRTGYLRTGHGRAAEGYRAAPRR